MINERVLLVDDDDADVLFLKGAMERVQFPYPMTVARDGAEALKILEDSPALPRLVILDLRMPKLGGLELLRRIRASERLRGARVAVLTGSNDHGDRRDAELLGALLFLRKPTDTSLYLDVALQLRDAAMNGYRR